MGLPLLIPDVTRTCLASLWSPRALLNPRWSCWCFNYRIIPNIYIVVFSTKQIYVALVHLAGPAKCKLDVHTHWGTVWIQTNTFITAKCDANVVGTHLLKCYIWSMKVKANQVTKLVSTQEFQFEIRICPYLKHFHDLQLLIFLWLLFSAKPTY